MSVEEQVADLRVLVAGEMAEIKGVLQRQAEALEHWAEHTRRQNHRIDAIENWIAARTRDLAHAAGVIAGRAELRRRDLAVLAGIVAGISALSAAATHVGDLIRVVGG